MKWSCRPFSKYVFISGCFHESELHNLNLKNNISLISNGVGNCFWNCKRKGDCGSTSNIKFGLQVSETCTERNSVLVRIAFFALCDNINNTRMLLSYYKIYFTNDYQVSFNCRVTTATAIARNLMLRLWHIALIVIVPAVFGPSRRENAVAISISVHT